MRARIVHGLIRNQIRKLVRTPTTRQGLPHLHSVNNNISTSSLQVITNVPRGNFHTCISSQKENNVPWTKYFCDRATTIIVIAMDGENESTVNLSTKNVESKRKQTQKESDDVSDKNTDVLMKQEKDLADYRKRQKERWKKSNVVSKTKPSKELPQNAEKCHKPLKGQKERTRDVVRDVVCPTTSRQDAQKSHKSIKERKNRTRDVIQDVSLPTTSRQDTQKSHKSIKERKERTRDIIQDVSFPKTSRQDTPKIDQHARGEKDRIRNVVEEISSSRKYQRDAEKGDIYAKEQKDGNHNLVQDLSSPTNSRNKKRRRKRRHRASEGETPDRKRVSLDNNERRQMSCSSDVIDLDPVSISDSSCTVTNGDILEIQDMDLATSDDEDIVLLPPSPRPGTSSEGQMETEQRETKEHEDDVMYMGTVINLVDSPPTQSSETSRVSTSSRSEVSSNPFVSAPRNLYPRVSPPTQSSSQLYPSSSSSEVSSNPFVPGPRNLYPRVGLSPPTQSSSQLYPSSSSSEVSSNPFVPGPRNLYPRASTTEYVSYPRQQQQQPMPYSATNPYMYSSASSSMAYSTASDGFQTVSTSVSRFMTAAAFGNTITPSPHLGFPNSSQLYGGQGQVVSGNTWPQNTMGFGQQPAASFHQSTETAARRNNWPSAPGRTQSSHRRESHKLKRTKLRDRKWVLVDEEIAESQGYMNFTVASYNILAQNLLEDNSQLYDHSEQRYLRWGYRSRNLLEEIEQYCPDILCLQEVKEDHYHRHFKPRLESIGYFGCYKKRTRDMQDGCATFFKTDKFELDVCKPLEYFTRGTSILDRDNVALIVRLIPRDKSTNNKIVVANTHLLFNPRRGDVKLAQLVLMLAEVDRLAYCGRQGINPLSPKYHPTLLMGDFNSEPQSPLYQLLASGNIEYVGQPMNLFSGQSEGRRGSFKVFDNTVLPRKLKVTDFCQHEDDVRKRFSCWDSAREGADSIDHGKLWGSRNSSQHTLSHVDLLQHDCGTYRTFLPLHSAYKHHTFSMQRQRREKEVTTHHGCSKCTVDYIFYASGSRGVTQTQNQQLRLVRRLELLTDTEMNKLGPLPNGEVSSDHTLLGAAFQLKL